MTREDPGTILREPLFLIVTAKSEPKVRVGGDNLIVARGQMARPEATDQSNTGVDWANVVRFFEVDHYASAEQALSAI